MSLTDQVQQVIEAGPPKTVETPEFAKLRDFYVEMQRLGIATKQEYNLPPLDTVGRRLHELTQIKVSRR